MTAEMVIMNASAVALAADSAVTITRMGHDGQPAERKIYANANKLFELVRGRPIGMLIYNSADLVSVPWETLVKRYRRDHAEVRFGTAVEYADSFCKYLNDHVEWLFPQDMRDTFIHQCVSTASRDFISMAEGALGERVADGASVKVTNPLRKQVLNEVLDGLEKEIMADDISDWADGLDEDSLLKKYGTDSLKVVPEPFQKYQITLTERKRICRIAYAYALRRGITPSGTGVAITGFGERETFPTMVHLNVGGIIENRIIAHGREVIQISAEERSHIVPLAQSGEAATFLTGIDPVFRERITAFWQTWIGNLEDVTRTIVSSELPNLDAKTLDAISGKFKKFGDGSWNRFATHMNSMQSLLRMGPIEASAAFLSKQELAGLAENLIDLASLRNRVSIDRAETVGGAIDVAVVSPGDGFVWIKRKHYFDLDLNPNWPGNQAATAVPYK